MKQFDVVLQTSNTIFAVYHKNKQHNVFTGFTVMGNNVLDDSPVLQTENKTCTDCHDKREV